jgi:dCTP deaminase
MKKTGTERTLPRRSATRSIRLKRLPWDDWIPGVLSRGQMHRLIKSGQIDGAIKEAADYSSIDLHLANEAYVLRFGSVKPFGDPYCASLKNLHLVRLLPDESNGIYTLIARKTYLFRLKERIGHLRRTPIFGRATAKSSIGRMDVLARLVVDGMDEYEGFDPEMISSGDMFVEITPMTFNVRVRAGSPITQLRLFKGHPNDCRINGTHLFRTVLSADDGEMMGTLSVDLTPVKIAQNEVAAFCASRQPQGSEAFPLWKQPEAIRPKPWKHWQFRQSDANLRLRIQKNRFYIIRSHEKIWLPGGVAVYCRASDETIGEMRIHYAGFVHPFFGGERDDNQRGTPLIFEVRGHDVDVSLRHREKMARLEFYRMSEDCAKLSTGSTAAYASQTLKLSQFFGMWPSNARVGNDGTVVPK